MPRKPGYDPTDPSGGGGKSYAPTRNRGDRRMFDRCGHDCLVPGTHERPICAALSKRACRARVFPAYRFSPTALAQGLPRHGSDPKKLHHVSFAEQDRNHFTAAPPTVRAHELGQQADGTGAFGPPQLRQPRPANRQGLARDDRAVDRICRGADDPIPRDAGLMLRRIAPRPYRRSGPRPCEDRGTCGGGGMANKPRNARMATRRIR